MNMINKYILKEKNFIFSFFVSFFIVALFLKFGLSFQFFKLLFLTFVLSVIGFIDFKTQDVYTSHIIFGALGGFIFLGIQFFYDNVFEFGSITAFLIFIFGMIVIGVFDCRAEDERKIYFSMVCIYLLYFILKGNLNFIDVFSACVIPSLVIGALALAGGMGWGDVEIIFICGLFLSFKMSLLNLFIGILLGGVYSIYLIIFKKKMGKTKIAFGPYIAIGTGVTVLFGEQILAWYINLI
ncbi:MAG: prepilin peptidase [Clostridium sp.]|uniref:prepilin peptidase n=1 Tax=Clostridium sp. TaxID=1506 RepID=UPI003F3A9F75